jgi:hypothetical protein
MLKEEQITSEQISSEDIHTEHVLSQPQSVDTADIQGGEGKNNEDTSEKESPNVPDTSKDYTQLNVQVIVFLSCLLHLHNYLEVQYQPQ